MGEPMNKNNNNTRFYIDGAWVSPVVPKLFDLVNPATEESIGAISLGSADDVDRAVIAARKAFATYSQTSKRERLAFLRKIIICYKARFDDIARAITEEMGSPLWFSKKVQVQTALDHFEEACRVLEAYEFEHMMGGTRIVREPIGVCGLITPWNWPVNQVASKLAPALAAGCTVVVKPSEMAPLSSIILAEVLHDSGLPKGVFNLVNGDGPTVGHAIASHPDIDLVSFTGSTRAGILVAQTAAATVKRVAQELGGKSANILLPDVDLAKAVAAGVMRSFTNSGQSCQAPTRMLVHRDQMDQAIEIARKTADAVFVGSPYDDKTQLGPLISKTQFERVQKLIETGIAEKATVVCGGPGRPAGLNRGYYVRPTIFAHVTPTMTLAQQEIFGPVLVMMSYKDEDDAVEIANGTVYGLAGYVWSSDIAKARRIGARLRAGRIYLNNAPHGKAQDVEAPFGGYKQSGNGRECGVFGFEEYLEVKAVIGYDAT
jgi:aldehyde dehydrogenase (NAD+)